MILNAVIAVGLMPWIGFAAAAWATTIAGWIMVAQLWIGSRRMGDEARLDARSKSRLPRIALASLSMGAALWGASWGMGGLLADAVWRYAALAGLIAIGIVSYFGIGAAIGAFKLSDFRALRGQR
jgi:putative peptidoglycan lipid II flippase